MLSQQKETLTWIFGVIITVCGIIAITLFPFDGNYRRAPSSVKEPKSTKGVILEKGKHLRERKIAKASGPVEVTISAPAKGAIIPGAIFELEAKIEAMSAIDGLKFAWILPQDGGVTIVSGPDQGEIGTMTEGQTTTVRVSIQTQTADNRQVHLNVFTTSYGEPRGTMSQYNTVDQEVIEAQARSKAEVLERTAEVTGQELKLIQ